MDIEIVTNEIGELLEDALDDVFLKMQDEYGITNGDISPYEYWCVGDALQILADEIAKVIMRQARDEIFRLKSSEVK